MKKSVMFLAGLILATIVPGAAVVDITARGQYFRPTDGVFREIYGGGWKAGGEIGIRLFGRFDLWAGGDSFSRAGKLTFTGEETTLSLLPLSGGVRYRLTTGPVSLYAAAGVVACRFKESNPIGDAEKTGWGGVVRAGVFLRLFRGLCLHAAAGYSYIPMKPADFDIDVGGLEAGGGLAVEF